MVSEKEYQRKLKAAGYAEKDGQVSKVFSELVDGPTLQHLFGKTELTIFNWRKYHGLPYVRLPGVGRDTIRFELAAVEDWARIKGITMTGKAVRR